jgi:dipeptidyl aminopeptidase/acylaminoacyl peptidase
MLMQDDITWGVKYLVSKGIVDAKKIGIMGGSYGGYATLAGLAFTPDLYAVGVSIVGPSNLITLLNSLPPYWEAGRKIFYERMGDPTTEKGKELLMKQSPLNSASKIKVPLLIIQGANDPRVNKNESEQIVIALRDFGTKVEYICAPDEGHGYIKPLNNMAALSRAEIFLANSLKGRYQQNDPEDVIKTLRMIKVNIDTLKTSK